jgi:hypothetical protein
MRWIRSARASLPALRQFSITLRLGTKADLMTSPLFI